MPSGANTFIAINKQYNQRLEHPFSSCYKNSKSKKYNQAICIRTCLHQQIMTNCSCYNALVPGNFSLQPCLTYEQNRCLLDTYYDFFSSKISKSCDCPEECDTLVYSLSQSFSKFPSKPFAEFLLQMTHLSDKYEIKHENIRESILKLNVYYEHLYFVRISETAKMDFFNLVSGVGGTMGLFIGISFMSFLEIFQLCFRIILILIRRKRSNQKS